MNIYFRYFYSGIENEKGAKLLVKHGDMKQVGKFKKSCAVFLVCCFAMLILCAGLDSYFLASAVLVWMVLILGTSIYNIKVKLPREMAEANSNMCGVMMTMGFYEEYFFTKEEHPLFVSECSERYENLQKIVETETDFLIFSRNNTYNCIPKYALNPEDICTLSFFFQRFTDIYKFTSE